MKRIEANKHLIAACGLYCGACRKYLSAKCPGCHENERATWCKIRTCVRNKGFNTCAECDEDVTRCKTYSNLIGKLFAFLFKSDRPACIKYIREHGEEAFAEEMTRRKCQTMKTTGAKCLNWLVFFGTIYTLLLTACSDVNMTEKSMSLREQLYTIVDTVQGTVGIAFISDRDTVTINNGVHYPMMSVFKLHQALAYLNYSSPLSAASLIRQVFDSTFTNISAVDSIKKDLTTVATGSDRLGAIIPQHPDLFFAHKTGSGYRNDAGELVAHNDIGYFRLPDGRTYALAVFIRDFSGTETEASGIIAGISNIVYDYQMKE